jgi:hypothetical protein
MKIEFQPGRIYPFSCVVAQSVDWLILSATLDWEVKPQSFSHVSVLNFHLLIIIAKHIFTNLLPYPSPENADLLTTRDSALSEDYRFVKLYPGDLGNAPPKRRPH